MYPPETVALRSTQVRALEARVYESVPAGSLMQKVAMAIAVRAAGELREHRGLVVGGRVVLLVGTGDNGGDALFAGAHLARRGARVDALLTGDRAHAQGRIAFERAGGSCHQANVEFRVARDLMFEADVIIDGIVGIGGSGALREPAAKLAALTHAVDSIVIAVDLPSGVDCDSGHTPHPRQTVMADLTITSGCLKPALVVMPAAQFSGDIEVVDIGLELTSLDDDELLIRIDDRLAAQWLDRPHELDHKFSRGVVGIASGSPIYPGAAVLSTGGARGGIAGFVRYAGRAVQNVTAQFPDVVCADSIAAAGRVQCWVVGPGLGTDGIARTEVTAALNSDACVVLDADAITLLATDPELADLCRNRDRPTILTPHRGEFQRLAGRPLSEDPISHLTSVAERFGAIILLKGPTTLIVTASGSAYVVDSGPAELGTAGSGDVLAGLMGSMIAAHDTVRSLDHEIATEIAAVAAYVHGIAGQIAVADGGTITSVDVYKHIPAAIGFIRRAGEQGSDEGL
jgi:hydroxyethylthiazole kinase-like uncharacterized protein yjeF